MRLFSQKGEEIATVKLGTILPGETEKRYVRVDTPGEAGTVAVVSTSGLSSLSKAASEFRARKAISFRTWDVTGVNLTSPGITLSFVKKDGIWSATSPASLKVNGGAVEDTLQTLADLEVVSFDAAKGVTPQSLGLDPPRTKIEIQLGPPASQVRALVLGSATGTSNVVYARAQGRPVFSVSASILDRIKGGATLYAERAPALNPSTATTPSATKK